VSRQKQIPQYYKTNAIRLDYSRKGNVRRDEKEGPEGNIQCRSEEGCDHLQEDGCPFNEEDEVILVVTSHTPTLCHPI
jgi:hypothetical protein